MSASVATDHAARLAVLEEISQGLKASSDRLERRLEGMDRRLEAMEDRLNRRLEAVEARLIALQTDQRSDFRWLVGGGIAAFAALLSLLGHAQHWV